MLRNREVCSWLDVWLGMFLCPAAGPGGFFMVRDFAEEAVVALE